MGKIKEQLMDILELYENGMTIQQIADIHGMTYEYVENIIRQYYQLTGFPALPRRTFESYIMKNVILLCGILALSACASHEPKQIPGTEKVEKLDRREVIQAVTACEDAGMRGYVDYVTTRTDYGKVLVPIDVHCMVKRK